MRRPGARREVAVPLANPFSSLAGLQLVDMVRLSAALIGPALIVTVNLQSISPASEDRQLDRDARTVAASVLGKILNDKPR